jgi:hypothetical protein
MLEIKDLPKEEMLIRTYVETFPQNVKEQLEKSLRKVERGSGERVGNGHYHSDKQSITLGFTPNVWYFLELLGHEMGHACNVENYYVTILPDCKDPHILCDHFSRYLLYGDGELHDFFSEKMGKRDHKILSELHEKIKEYAINEKEENRNHEKIPNSIELFNEDQRFLRV